LGPETGESLIRILCSARLDRCEDDPTCRGWLIAPPTATLDEHGGASLRRRDAVSESQRGSQAVAQPEHRHASRTHRRNRRGHLVDAGTHRWLDRSSTETAVAVTPHITALLDEPCHR